MRELSWLRHMHKVKKWENLSGWDEERAEEDCQTSLFNWQQSTLRVPPCGFSEWDNFRWSISLWVVYFQEAVSDFSAFWPLERLPRDALQLFKTPLGEVQRIMVYLWGCPYLAKEAAQGGVLSLFQNYILCNYK